jgi:hypothetical protein
MGEGVSYRFSYISGFFPETVTRAGGCA